MGVRIDDVNYSGVSEKIRKTLRKNGKAYICVNDVANIVIANQDREVFKAINLSLLSIADGTPLAWFGKLVGCKNIERISGMDLMENLFAEKRAYKHYLLGDTEQTIGRVMEKAKQKYQGISIEGHSPPFKDFDDVDNRKILEKLKKAKPDIIWVSLGGGKQDNWMYNNINSLDRGVMIGVGAAFRWFTGELKTPPKIVQKMGLQQTYRIAHHLSENPWKNLRFVVGTILKRDVIFVLNFPGEVIRARRKRLKDICAHGEQASGQIVKDTDRDSSR
jgi:N-acetylglucosaminyldiphosphoundecaprenol N-acetyl-beta-D-mannosaminyltransferase